MTLNIVFEGDTAYCVYDDALLPALEELGTIEVHRASHVEPARGGGWTADMSPEGGPLLGPYRERGQALEAEREWLRRERGL